MNRQLSLLDGDDPVTHWRCPKCGTRLTMYIPIIYTPRCTRHIRGGTDMKQENHP